MLARQHMASLAPLAQATGIRMALLTGRERSGREATLAALAAGEIDILVGTHALFSEDVAFADLGLAVIDEQHRFGVHQRMALQGKGGRPADVLVMTATPIPRTLALTSLWRHGRLAPHRAPAGPQAGRDPHDLRRATRRSRGTSAQGYRQRRPRLLGLPAGRGVREDRPRRRRRTRRHAQNACSVPRSAWCTVA
ncbi:MAG: DEAD/DEAH box helicase [Rhizomicrobium sp.]